MLFKKSILKNASAENAKEGTEYVIFKDGNMTEHKLLNLDHEMYAPFTGIIELEPTKVSKYMNGSDRNMADVSFKSIRDRNTGFIIGIPLGVDPETKRIMWERINLRGRETFDLSIPDQRARWVCIKNSHFYINSPNFQSGSKLAYKANDREEDNRTYELTRRVRRKASDIVDTLHGEELEEMGMMLGYDPSVMSTTSLFTAISKYVENPSRLDSGKTGAEIFVELYESDTRVDLSILKKGLHNGIIESTHDRGMVYRGTTLGFTEQEVLKTFRDNASVRTSIDLQTKSAAEGTSASMRKAPEQMTEAEAKIARLERMLAEKDEELKSERGVKLTAAANDDIEQINPRYAELLEEARRIKVPSPHLLGGKNASVDEKIEKLEIAIQKHSKIKSQ